MRLVIASLTAPTLLPSRRSSIPSTRNRTEARSHSRGRPASRLTANLPVAEYAPLTIKATVTGYGLAQKEQVQFMVARLLRLPSLPEPADAADALAIAICHIQHAQTLALQTANL